MTFETTPVCPLCGAPTVRRTDNHTQEQFYGCSKYPECLGSLNLDGSLPETHRREFSDSGMSRLLEEFFGDPRYFYDDEFD